MDRVMARGQQFERLIARIKRHLASIQDYYADENYPSSSLILSAVRREQENIVSLASEMVKYEDLLEKLYLFDENKSNEYLEW